MVHRGVFNIDVSKATHPNDVFGDGGYYGFIHI